MVERSLSMREVQGSIPCISTFCFGGRSRRTQAVKGVDSKSTGLCPRRFESCRLRVLTFKSSPTRIRTAVAGFRVLSANHYTMGDDSSRRGKCHLLGLNQGPSDLQSDALPTELKRQLPSGELGPTTFECALHSSWLLSSVVEHRSRKPGVESSILSVACFFQTQ